MNNYVKEEHLINWSTSYEAEGKLPDLIRRIIYNCVKKNEFLEPPDFPANSVVNRRGIDGKLKTKSSNFFSSTPFSVWELSTSKSVLGKANKDIIKRNNEIDRINSSNITYIALTSNRWDGKTEWAEARKNENIWADVRAYDCTDITGWLGNCTAVELWFLSEVLNLDSKLGMMTASQFIRNWENETEPILPISLLLIEREYESKLLKEWLSNLSKIFSIRAETQKEAIAFYFAVINSLDEFNKEYYLSQSLVINDKKLINNLENTMHIIIPFLSDYNNIFFNPNNKFIFFTTMEATLNPDICLDPFKNRDLLLEYLKKVLPVSYNLKKIINDSGGKITSLKRLINQKDIHTFNWISKENQTIVIGLLLSNSWNPKNEKDIKNIEFLCNSTYQDIEKTIHHLMTCEDPPLRRQGDIIKWRSIRDSWNHLYTYILNSDINNLLLAAKTIFKDINPKYNLPIKERFYSKIIMEYEWSCSDTFKNGISESFALLGIYLEKIKDNPAITIDVHLKMKLTLNNILTDDWKVWATISDNLQRFAEAIPEYFIDIVEDYQKKELLNELFYQDPKGEDHFNIEPTHSNLLWSLEILAWKEEYFIRVIRILMHFSKIDKEGVYVNRPLNSLIVLLNPRIKRTNAKLETRIRALRMIINKDDNFALDFLIKYANKMFHGGVINGPTLPKYVQIELKENFEKYTKDDSSKIYNYNKSELCKKINTIPLNKVIKIFTQIPSAIYNDIVTSLSLRNDFDKIDKKLKIDFYIELLTSGRFVKEPNYPNIIEEIKDKLFRNNYMESNAYIFKIKNSFHIKKKDESYEDYDNRIKNNKITVLNKIMNDGGVKAVFKLANIVQEYYSVGYFLGETTNADLIAENIKNEYIISSNNKNRNLFGIGFYVYFTYKQGSEFLKQFLQELMNHSKLELARSFLTYFDLDEDILNFLDQNEELSKLFWLQIDFLDSRYIKSKIIFKKTKDNLIKHKRIDLLFNLLGSISESINKYCNADDYLYVLDYPKNLSEEDKAMFFSDSLRTWHIENIFNELYKLSDLPIEDIFNIECLYIPILKYSKWIPKFINQKLNNEPNFFMELICNIYKSENDDPDKPIPMEIAKIASFSNDILGKWHSFPGENEERENRNKLIKEWCLLVIEIAKEKSRKIIAEQQIGIMLARVPNLMDNIWPCEVAREFIEDGNVEIGKGLSIGKFNSRGVTSRSLTDGGAQEKELASKYTENSKKIEVDYPETTKLLKQMAEDYLSDADWNDKKAEEFIDP